MIHLLGRSLAWTNTIALLLVLAGQYCSMLDNNEKQCTSLHCFLCFDQILTCLCLWPPFLSHLDFGNLASQVTVVPTTKRSVWRCITSTQCWPTGMMPPVGTIDIGCVRRLHVQVHSTSKYFENDMKYEKRKKSRICTS